MPATAIRTALKVDFEKPAAEQPYLHNRWHPDIPSVGEITPGEAVKIECIDWTGGQIGNNDSADDVKNVDLTKVHYLSGPFDIKGAEPGDVLVVEIQDIQPFEHRPWGFTAVFDRRNGGGFLDEHYGQAAKGVFLCVQWCGWAVAFPGRGGGGAANAGQRSGTLRASSARRGTSPACGLRG